MRMGSFRTESCAASVVAAWASTAAEQEDPGVLQKEGELLKKGVLNSAWQRRHFVLSTDGRLRWFAHKSAPEKASSTNTLRRVATATINGANSAEGQFAFSVVFSGIISVPEEPASTGTGWASMRRGFFSSRAGLETVVLASESATLRDEWIDAINSVAHAVGTATAD